MSLFNRLQSSPSGEKLARKTHRARTRVAWRITRGCLRVHDRLPHPAALIREVLPSAQIAEMHLTSLSGQKFPCHPGDSLNYSVDWARAVIQLAKELNTEVILPTDPLQTSEFTWGLFHPNESLRANWPSLREIISYEGKAIQYTLKMLTQVSTLEVHHKLLKSMYLLPIEAQSLIAMARTHAKEFADYDQEDERSLMTLRLQELQQRARAGLNLREEMNALKMEALVRGITKSAPEGLLDTFARVVLKDSHARTPSTLDVTRAPALGYDPEDPEDPQVDQEDDPE